MNSMSSDFYPCRPPKGPKFGVLVPHIHADNMGPFNIANEVIGAKA